MMSGDLPQTFSSWLQLGQRLEAEGRIVDAVGAYDRAIELLRSNPAARDVADRRALAIAWMNRGNALQKLPHAVLTVGEASRPDAAPTERTATPTFDLGLVVQAYNEAIALLETLPYETDALFRNHLGAAWLNRGHALLVATEIAEAARSFEQSVALLHTLPFEADPNFRLNFTGALTNLAHATLASTPDRAIELTRGALEVLQPVEREHDAFAAMSMRARRALVMGIGEALRRGIAVPARATGAILPPSAPAAGVATVRPADLAHEATDAIEEGLALARGYEQRGHTALRPLAARLFRLGAQIYRLHQPHFLAEFVLEIFEIPALAADREFNGAAETALVEALEDVQWPKLFIAGTPDAEQRLELAQSLRTALARVREYAGAAPPPDARVPQPDVI